MRSSDVAKGQRARRSSYDASYLFSAIQNNEEKYFKQDFSKYPPNLIDSSGKFFSVKNTTLISAAVFNRRNKIIERIFSLASQYPDILNILEKDDSGRCAIDHAAGDGYSDKYRQPADPQLTVRLIKAAFDQAESNNDSKAVSECLAYIKKYRDCFTTVLHDYASLGWMLAGGSKNLARDETQAFYFFNLCVGNSGINSRARAMSSYYMGYYYLRGVGTEKSFTESYRRASEAYEVKFDAPGVATLATQNILDPLAKTADLKEDAKGENQALHNARMKLLKHYLTSDEKKSEEYADLITDEKIKNPWKTYFSASKMIRSGKEIEGIKLLAQCGGLEEAKTKLLNLATDIRNNDTTCAARIAFFQFTANENSQSRLIIPDLIKAAFNYAERNNDRDAVLACLNYIKKYREWFGLSYRIHYSSLGWMLLGGSKGLAKDETLAIHFFTGYVRWGIPITYSCRQSAYHLAQCYLLGMGTEKDFSKAYEYGMRSYDPRQTEFNDLVFSNVLDPLARTADSKEDPKKENHVLHNARIKLIKHYLPSDAKKSEEYAGLLTDEKEKNNWKNYFLAKKIIAEGKPIKGIKLLLKHPDIEEIKIALISVVQINNGIARQLARIELFKLTKDEKYRDELPREWQAYCRGISAIMPRDEKAAVTAASASLPNVDDKEIPMVELCKQAADCYCSYDVPGAIKIYSELANRAKSTWNEEEIILHRDRISHLHVIAAENELREIAKITSKFNLVLNQIMLFRRIKEEKKLLEEWKSKFISPKEYDPLVQFYFRCASEQEAAAISCMQEDQTKFADCRIAAIDFYVNAFKFATDAQKLMLIALVEKYASEEHNRAAESDQKKNNVDVVSYAKLMLKRMEKSKSFFESAMAIFSSDKNKTATASAAANTAANATLTPTQQLMVVIANTAAPKPATK